MNDVSTFQCSSEVIPVVSSEQKTSRSLRVGYVAGTSYCGSTLTSFILNTHPNIFSPGEMGPGESAEREGFPCSCGTILAECPFYVKVTERMKSWGVPFDLRHWKLRYRFSKNQHLERLARGALGSRLLEDLRHKVWTVLPTYRDCIGELERRNEAFIRACLEVSGKSVFLDATKHPSRIPELRRIPSLDLRIIHLIRDPRGYCNSAFKKRRVAIEEGARRWVEGNRAAQRQLSALPRDKWLYVTYESLASQPDSVFSRLAEFLGADSFNLPDNFRAYPHHIVGSRMRLASHQTTVEIDETWKKELSAKNLKTISEICGSFARRFGYDI
jgi:hypothetical protein